MGKKLGNEYMLWIESAVAGTYNLIKGQGALTINRSATKFDTSSKDDLGYGTELPGIKSLSAELDIIPNLPDANGYTLLETKANASPPVAVKFQIRKGGAAGLTGDAVFECLMTPSLDSTAFGQNEAVKVKCALSAAAAPTIDTLS